MKLQLLRVRVISQTTASALESDVNAFLDDPSVRELVSIQYQVSVAQSESAVIDSADSITQFGPTAVAIFSALIAYTE